jgi:hypothetical protein
MNNIFVSVIRIVPIFSDGPAYIFGQLFSMKMGLKSSQHLSTLFNIRNNFSSLEFLILFIIDSFISVFVVCTLHTSIG